MQPFPTKNLKPLPPMLIINLEYWSKFSKDNVKWLKTTIFLVNLIWMASHLLQEEFLKSKLHSKLMKTVSWMSLLLIKEHQRMLKSPLPTTKEDFLKIKSKDLLNKQKNIRMLIKKLERELKPRMPSKAIVFQLNILLMMKNWKTNLMQEKKLRSNKKWDKLNHGYHQTLKQTLLNMKEN